MVASLVARAMVGGMTRRSLDVRGRSRLASLTWESPLSAVRAQNRLLCAFHQFAHAGGVTVRVRIWCVCARILGTSGGVARRQDTAKRGARLAACASRAGRWPVGCDWCRHSDAVLIAGGGVEKRRRTRTRHTQQAYCTYPRVAKGGCGAGKAPSF